MTLQGSISRLPKEYLRLGIAASGSTPQTDFLCSLMYMHAYLFIYYFVLSSTLPFHAHTGVNPLTLFGVGGRM